MVRAYSRGLDYYDVCGWFEARGFSCPPADAFPSVGSIVPGVAAGFLYRTDSVFAIIDMYISAPDSDPVIRNEALDAISSDLLNKAKQLGFKYVKCETKITAIGARAERMGFQSQGTFTYYVKEL